ncbi:MAG: ParB/RepB/Spo0J family partition protein [Chloroflexi bacterium]|nr:ParB/RepB/Spo0J family partition protein [Chloroflexota bacterium]
MGKSTTPTKRALGRGLGALIVNTEIHHPDDPISSSQLDDTGSGIGVSLLSLEVIRPNPQQPRTIFDEAALQDLAASIRAHGIIQPLIVTENPTQPNTYWLVAGERRWRAARLANLTEVPVLVREASPQQLMELALVENVQRADLSALEEAAAYQTLLSEFGLTHQEIAERVGKSRSAVTNTLRLLELPLLVQDALASNHISAGHARALLPLRNPTAIQQALQQVLAEELNVRQTEALITRLLVPKVAPPAKPAPKPAAAEQLAYLENRFRTALGTRVQLNRSTNGSGKLVVHFYNDDDLEQLYKLIAGGDEAD